MALEPPRTYERQAGAKADAKFTDPFDDYPAVWRPPNERELELIRDEVDDIEGLYIAVIDGYQTDGPGYAGPLAVVVGGDPELTLAFPLEGKGDE